MISTVTQPSTQTTNTTLTAEDGKSYLYQNQQQLVSDLFSGGSMFATPTDIFSPSFLYSAVTTRSLSQADPAAFNISSAEAMGLGLQIQAATAASLLKSMVSNLSGGVDVLGSLYAANGMVSSLATAKTYTFQGLA